MASNRPVPSNYDITSRPVPFINKALCGPASVWPEFERRCDHGHRLLLVYVGGLRWMEGTKNHPEYPPLHPGDEALHHWNGTSIEYVLFRPGDNKVLAEGTIADIKDYEYYNELGDHALFPEVAWNEATGEWTVIWEEFRSEGEIGTGPAWRRWATTIDEDGNVGKLTDLGICFQGVTSIGGPKEEKAEKDVSFKFDGHCGLVNMANDYYSMEGIDWAGDRNPTHSSLVSSYSNWYNFHENWPYRSSNQWLDRYAKELLFNEHDEIQKQPFRDRQSIAVIGHPDFRELTRFE